jgi:prepilin-type processing-associated H-X9-DG protein
VYPPGRVGDDGVTTPAPQRVGTSGLVLALPPLDLQNIYDLFDFRDGPWCYNTTWYLGTNATAIATRPSVFVCPSDDSLPVSDNTVVGGGYDIGGRPAATGSYALVAGTIGPAPVTNPKSSGGITAEMKYSNTGMFYYVTSMKEADVTDGLSNTMFLGEVVEGHTLNSSNIWSRNVRAMDTSRSTSNPVNTWPGEPVYDSAYGLRVNGAFASRHPGGANFAFGDGRVVFVEENIDMRAYQALSTRDNGEVVGEL